MTTPHVSLKYESFQHLLDACSTNVSQEGIFLSTPDVHPVGSEVEFDVGLGSDFPVLRGRGRVVRHSEPGDPLPGMALRFVETDTATATLVDRIVERQRIAAAPVFELGAAEVAMPIEEEVAAGDETVEAIDADLLEAPTEVLVEPLGEEPLEQPAELSGEDLAATMVFETGEPRPPAEPEETAEPVVEEVPAVEVEATEVEAELLEVEEVAEPTVHEEPEADEAPAEEAGPEVPEELEAEAIAMPEGLAEGLEEQVLAEAEVAEGSKGRGALWGALVLVAALAGAAYWQRDWISDRLAGDASSGGPVESRRGSDEPELTAAADEMTSEDLGAAEDEAAETAVGEESSATTETAAPPAPTGPATRIEAIEWQELDGSTVLTLTANGSFDQGAIGLERLEDPPRVLVKIPGIGAPLAQPTRAVGSEEVVGVRTGLHQVEGGTRLHVVVDLASPTAEVARLEAEGARLQLEVASTAIAP